MTSCLRSSNQVWGWKKNKNKKCSNFILFDLNSKNITHLPFSSTLGLAKCWIELFSITCCTTNYLVFKFFFSPTWFDNFVISTRLKKLAKLWQKNWFFLGGCHQIHPYQLTHLWVLWKRVAKRCPLRLLVRILWK
jgi:hypothetical protein